MVQRDRYLSVFPTTTHLRHKITHLVAINPYRGPVKHASNLVASTQVAVPLLFWPRRCCVSHSKRIPLKYCVKHHATMHPKCQCDWRCTIVLRDMPGQNAPAVSDFRKTTSQPCLHLTSNTAPGRPSAHDARVLLSDIFAGLLSAPDMEERLNYCNRGFHHLVDVIGGNSVRGSQQDVVTADTICGSVAWVEADVERRSHTCRRC